MPTSGATSSWSCRTRRCAQPPSERARRCRRGPPAATVKRAGLTRRVAEALDQAGHAAPAAVLRALPPPALRRTAAARGDRRRPRPRAARLVADEPVSSLDASVRGEILKLFLHLRDELGLAALVVSHDLGLAWNIADRVAVMTRPHRRDRPVEEVLLHPRHPYTRALLEACPRRPGAASKCTCSAASRLTRAAIPAGCRFHPRCPLYAALPEEAAALCLADTPVLQADAGHRQSACPHTPDSRYTAMGARTRCDWRDG